MKFAYLLAMTLLLSCSTTPKESERDSSIAPVIERWAATDFRNENWHPENGQYFFSEQWTWHFINESLAEDDSHREGDFSVFVDPPSGTMLLTRAESHYQDEMTEWIIVEPSGSYLTGWSEHTGEKKMQRQSMKDFEDFAFRVSEQPADFEEFFVHTGVYEIFGENKYGWEDFNGKEWTQTYKMTNEESTVYTTTSPFSVRPLYLVEQTNGDLQLPINFRDFAYLLPENELVLKEMSVFYGKKVGFEFKSSSPASHFLDVNGYKLMK